MKNIALISIAGIVGVIVLAVLVRLVAPNFIGTTMLAPVSSSTPGTLIATGTPSASDPKNISFRIAGESITLTNGKFVREAAPGSAMKESFALFGEPVMGDLDGDGDKDAVMYLTQESGGSGTFFYIVIAVNDGGSYRGTNAMLLGDRIAPQNITIDNGNAVANFAERKPGEPFTAQPSIGKSIWVHLDPNTREIGELVKNFEGEADPSKMTLTMKTWKWIETDEEGGTKIIPVKPDVFTLTFKSVGTFSATTDCNGVGGEYKATGTTLTFQKMMSTLMFCEGSQEQLYSSMLGNVSGYHFTSKGELILELKDKKSTATFR